MRAPRPALAAAAPGIALVLALATEAGCGRPLLSARIDVPEIRITQAGQSFDPVSVPTASLCTLVPGCLQQTLGWDIGGEVPGLTEEGIRVDLRLVAVDVHLAVTNPGAGGDLAAIRGLRVALPDGRVLASYARPASGPPPVDLSVSGDTSVDVGGWLSGGRLGLRVEFDYDPSSPTLAAFTADVTAAFSLVATISYSSFL